MSGADDAPGQPFDAWQELKFALRELHYLASSLTVALGTDSEAANAITWDARSWQAADLLERTLADIGGLSAQWLRCSIIDRRGTDPLG